MKDNTCRCSRINLYGIDCTKDKQTEMLASTLSYLMSDSGLASDILPNIHVKHGPDSRSCSAVALRQGPHSIAVVAKKGGAWLMLMTSRAMRRSSSDCLEAAGGWTGLAHSPRTHVSCFATKNKIAQQFRILDGEIQHCRPFLLQPCDLCWTLESYPQFSIVVVQTLRPSLRNHESPPSPI